MNLETLLAARREADRDRDAAPIEDLAAAEQGLLSALGERPDGAWVKAAARVVAEHQRQGRADRVWALLRVMEAGLGELEERDPASAGRTHAALAAQALLEGAAEAFLDRTRRAMEAFAQAGDHEGEAAVERAAYGVALLSLGVDEEAERMLDAAIEGAQRARLGVAEQAARVARARLDRRRGLTSTTSTALAGAATISRPAPVSWLSGGLAPGWIAIADARAAAGDAAGAAAAMAEARRAVLAFASRLARADLRRSYLERIPEHRRALGLDRA